MTNTKRPIDAAFELAAAKAIKADPQLRGWFDFSFGRRIKGLNACFSNSDARGFSIGQSLALGANVGAFEPDGLERERFAVDAIWEGDVFEDSSERIRSLLSAKLATYTTNVLTFAMLCDKWAEKFESMDANGWRMSSESGGLSPEAHLLHMIGDMTMRVAFRSDWLCYGQRDGFLVVFSADALMDDLLWTAPKDLHGVKLTCSIVSFSYHGPAYPQMGAPMTQIVEPALRKWANRRGKPFYSEFKTLARDLGGMLREMRDDLDECVRKRSAK